MPLFAFANAGITLLDMSPADLFEGVSLAIIISLVLGKLLGIWLFSFATVKLRIAPAPEGADWTMMAGVAAMGGIGFTVSLFIANLSFPGSPELLNLSKLGIVAGSVISALLGMAVLRFSLPKKAWALKNQS